MWRSTYLPTRTGYVLRSSMNDHIVKSCGIIDLFTDYEELERKAAEEREALAKERKMQEALLNIKKKFGKNAILKGTSYEEGATARERNQQIGGHKA